MAMSRKDFEWVADRVAPILYSVGSLELVADDLQERYPRFNREKFLDRAIKAWEDNHELEEIDDEISF